MSFAFSSTTGAGTVSVTNGSTALTGTGTNFTSDFVAGTGILIAGAMRIIASIESTTAATLLIAYPGTTDSAASYGRSPKITQTGTDTSLAGLVGVTGVSVISIGSGETSRMMYLCIAAIIIDGTLSINPKVEELVVCASWVCFKLNSTRTLNINGSRTINSKIKYTQMRWLTCLIEVNNSNGVELYGTVNWNGGEAFAPSMFVIKSGSTVTINGGSLDQYQVNDDGSQRGGHYFRNEATNLIMTGLTLKRSFFNLAVVPTTAYSGYVPQQCIESFSPSGSLPKQNFYVDGYYTDKSSTLDVGMWQGAWLVFRNPSFGTDMLVGAHVGGNGASYGRVTVFQTFNPVVTTSAMAAISGAIVYMKDTNNGGRENYTSDSYSGGDDTADKIYISTTGAGGNLASSLSVMTGANSVLSGAGGGGTPNAGAYAWDYRCKSGNTTDDFDVYVWHYSYLLSKYTVILKGGVTGAIVTSGTSLLADSNVVLSSSATAALSTISTASNFYDYAKYYKCTATQANLEMNGIGNLIVTLSGTTINAGSYNVTIDPNAGSVFAISGSTITIKASTFTGNIITTGTVTLSNGAVLVGTYTDTNGTRVAITDANGGNLSTYVVKNSTDLGVVTNSASRNIFVGPSDVVKIYAIGYGKKQLYKQVTGNNASDYVLAMETDPYVNTAASTPNRDTIVSYLSVGLDAQSKMYLATNSDMRAFTPEEVLNGFNRFIFLNPTIVGAYAISVGHAVSLTLGAGKVVIASQNLYAKVNDSVTSVADTGIYIPIYIDVDPAVYVADPTYTPIKKNTSGIVLGYALWTKASAELTTTDKTALRNGLAMEATVTSTTNTLSTKIDTVKANTDLIPATL